MTELGNRCHRSIAAALVAALALLGGCTSPTTRAPVEDRASVTGANAAPDAPAKPLPGAENEGKPGYYTVRKGDTLIRIGLDSGQNWRDIVRWNNLENPNAIEVGQVIRIAPPVGSSVVAASTPPERGVVTRPLAPASTAPSPSPAAVTPTALPPVGAPPSVAPANPPAAPTAGPDGGSDDAPRFTWPTSGPLLAGFDEQRNKGLDIGGHAGDAVLAAADGRVVYSGAGLRGYGNLIILKHNNTFLTAYAHNRTLLVKEDQSVQKGQKIAEMGETDADRVKLHFEIRRQGRPVDPARYLPPR